MRLATLEMILIVLLTSLMFPVLAAQATKKILLDNDKVQLVEVSYPPGTESGMHSHIYPSRVVYVVQGGTVELQPDNVELPSRTLTLETGNSLYLPAQTHNVINRGTTEVILLETELKYE